MRILKEICMTIFLLVKQAFLLPQSIANAFKEKRRWALRKDRETERLDRIRNPAKYLGK
jgi:hypothetical protein